MENTNLAKKMSGINKTEEKIFVDLKAEIEQIFVELGMDDPKCEVFDCLKEIIFVAVQYPNTWQKGYLEAFAHRYGVTRERIRQKFWKITAESWKPSSIKILTEHFGYPIEPHFEIISKPHNAEFTILLADNLRAKYQIQPKEEDYEWQSAPVERKLLNTNAEDSEDEFIDDEDFITVDNFYWDTLHLADELYEQGKYDEAEELYKEIANEEDEFGDASAHYGYLLDEMGRYEEAFTCFCQALNGDTSPAEGVSVFLDERLCDEDSPYWHYWQRNFDWRLRRYLETCESIGKKPDLERVLLNCSKSKNDFCASQVIGSLIQIYGTGKLVLHNYDEGNYEVIEVAVPDLDKLKTFVAEVVKDENDVADILSYLCYDPENVDEASANALEAALLATTFDEAKKKAYNMLFCLYLFGREFDIYGDNWIEVPSLENKDKAVSLMSKMDVSRLVNNIFSWYDFDYEAIVDFLEEAHRAYPDDEHIAISLLLNVKTARLPELISNLSDNCAKSLIPDNYDLCSLTDGGIEIEDAEEFEAYYTSLLDFLTKYKAYEANEWLRSDIQNLLLSAYQFGVYLNNSCEYEMLELEDQEKAKDFAEKYGIELLSEPFDIDVF